MIESDFALPGVESLFVMLSSDALAQDDCDRDRCVYNG